MFHDFPTLTPHASLRRAAPAQGTSRGAMRLVPPPLAASRRALIVAAAAVISPSSRAGADVDSTAGLRLEGAALQRAQQALYGGGAPEVKRQTQQVSDAITIRSMKGVWQFKEVFTSPARVSREGTLYFRGAELEERGTVTYAGDAANGRGPWIIKADGFGRSPAGRVEARAAPTRLRAPPYQLGSSRWPLPRAPPLASLMTADGRVPPLWATGAVASRRLGRRGDALDRLPRRGGRPLRGQARGGRRLQHLGSRHLPRPLGAGRDLLAISSRSP